MILVELPDLLPRPETACNAAFRSAFYSRWGTGNWIVSGPARRAEYSRYRQTLSIKCVTGGTETYFVGARTTRVTDETWLVLNADREYSSTLEAPTVAHSFAIFFRPWLAEEVAAAWRQTGDEALEAGGAPERRRVEFQEALRPHDGSVTPLLRFIRRSVAMGVRDEQWLEEQLHFLLQRLLADHCRQRQAFDTAFHELRPTTRQELHRRLGMATDFMRSNLSQQLTLQSMAAASLLSPYHFLRQFRRAWGCTPTAYLRELRVQKALAMRRNTRFALEDIAAETGMSRISLWRALRYRCGSGGAGGMAPRRM